MGKTNNSTKSKSVDGFKGVWQTWHQNGQVCPKGTLPVRRSSVHDVLRAKSLYDFGKKKLNNLSPVAARRPPESGAGAPDFSGHEVCFGFFHSFNFVY